MALTFLKKIEKKLSQRKFSEVQSLLEANVCHYRDSFQFYYLWGTTCLYLSDFAGARSFYKRARSLKPLDSKLIIGEAALFLRRGDIPSALSYYLDVLKNDPQNKQVKKILDFLKQKESKELIEDWRDSPKFERFYPSIRIKTSLSKIIFSCIMALLAPLLVFLLFKLGVFFKTNVKQRADLSALTLTSEQKNSLVDLNGSFQYILTKDEILKTYDKAKEYFQDYKDNKAQVEINRLLYSNASSEIKRQARVLMDYISEPGFDSSIEVFDYQTVAKEPYLYLDCYVIWKGSATNVVYYENSVTCDFLVGYETRTKLEGIIPLKMKSLISIDTERPLTVLARISLEDKILSLDGIAIYQPLGMEN